MDKPSIDELLENVPGGVFELATIAAKRAAWIRRKIKGSTEPLQQALEEIKDGKVNYKYRFKDEPEEGQQIEFDLDAKDDELEVDASGNLTDSVEILEDPDDADNIDEDEDDDEDDVKLKEKDSDDLGVTVDEDDITETIQKDQDYDDSDYD